MLTLEVAGTLLFLADEYLHPRTLATAALLLALAKFFPLLRPSPNSLYLLLCRLYLPRFPNHPGEYREAQNEVDDCPN